MRAVTSYCSHISKIGQAKMKTRKILFFILVAIVLGVLILPGCRGRQAVTQQKYVPYTEKEIRGLIIYQRYFSMFEQCGWPSSPRAHTRAEWEEILLNPHLSLGAGAKIIFDVSEKNMECLRAYCMAEAKDAPVVPRPEVRFKVKRR